MVLPNITYSTSISANSGTTVQSRTGFTVPGTSTALLAIITVTMQSLSGGTFSSLSVTAQPSGSVIAATLVESQTSGGGTPGLALYQAELPVGTTSIDLTQTVSANPFSYCRFHVDSIPVANLSSTTKVGSNKQRTTSTLSATTTLATSAGGVIVCAGVSSYISSANNGAFSGTETFTVRNTAISAGASHTIGDASNVATDGVNSVTVTYPNSGTVAIIAASWR